MHFVCTKVQDILYIMCRWWKEHVSLGAQSSFLPWGPLVHSWITLLEGRWAKMHSWVSHNHFVTPNFAHFYQSLMRKRGKCVFLYSARTKPAMTTEYTGKCAKVLQASSKRFLDVTSKQENLTMYDFPFNMEPDDVPEHLQPAE